jgi:hypothetical protein
MMSDWDESVFNDPRQVSMNFVKNPADDFSSFHTKNPWIWRQFRHLVLDKINAGIKNVDAKEIMRAVMGNTALRDDLVRQYIELFTSNHQELSHVFELPTQDPQKK